jgi:hypothetical protein
MAPFRGDLKQNGAYEMLVNGIKMTKAQVRVEVAKDVIRSLRLLTVRNGVYFKPAGSLELVNSIVSSSTDSKRVAQKLKNGCEVCALGACFLSSVRLTNKWEFEGFEEHWTGPEQVRAVEREVLEEKLHKIFTPFQIDLIETAFEEYNCTNLASDRNVIGRAISFGSKHYDSTSRLRAIMKNIIKNNGTFKP